MKVYHFEEVSSTNDLAREEQFAHGDLLWAERQTAGRGQRGHTWLSEEEVNLTFSLVVEPRFLPAKEQFLLSAATAVALCDCLTRYGIEARIKWTNDIYVEDRKIVGILIEHFYAGATLRRTVIGIGLNVNQEQFDHSLPNPTSMLLEGEKRYDREEVLRTFYACFMARYRQVEQGDAEAVLGEYHRLIYRLGEEQLFRLPNGEELTATIEGIESDGALRLLHAGGKRHSYHFKEIEFVIKNKKKDRDGQF